MVAALSEGGLGVRHLQDHPNYELSCRVPTDADPFMLPGGPLGGLFFSGITEGTIEDLLVLTIGGLAAYISVINLPLRCS